jgi:predicted metal-dependent peptidase
MKFVTDKEYNKIYQELLNIDKVFAEMWKRYERMVFDEDEDSAALEVSNANFRIVVNPKFWKRCNKHKKLFIICHEMCHGMFAHWMYPENFMREWANIAQDIQVNEFLFNNYKFSPSLINSSNHASIKTVFKESAKYVEKDKDYIYYYNLLMKCLRKD